MKILGSIFLSLNLISPLSFATDGTLKTAQKRYVESPKYLKKIFKRKNENKDYFKYSFDNKDDFEDVIKTLLIKKGKWKDELATAQATHVTKGIDGVIGVLLTADFDSYGPVIETINGHYPLKIQNLFKSDDPLIVKMVKYYIEKYGKPKFEVGLVHTAMEIPINLVGQYKFNQVLRNLPFPFSQLDKKIEDQNLLLEVTSDLTSLQQEILQHVYNYKRVLFYNPKTLEKILVGHSAKKVMKEAFVLSQLRKITNEKYLGSFLVKNSITPVIVFNITEMQEDLENYFKDKKVLQFLDGEEKIKLLKSYYMELYTKLVRDFSIPSEYPSIIEQFEYLQEKLGAKKAKEALHEFFMSAYRTLIPTIPTFNFLKRMTGQLEANLLVQKKAKKWALKKYGIMPNSGCANYWGTQLREIEKASGLPFDQALELTIGDELEAERKKDPKGFEQNAAKIFQKIFHRKFCSKDQPPFKFNRVQ